MTSTKFVTLPGYVVQTQPDTVGSSQGEGAGKFEQCMVAASSSQNSSWVRASVVRVRVKVMTDTSGMDGWMDGWMVMCSNRSC
jgi:hypothetical protein